MALRKRSVAEAAGGILHPLDDDVDTLGPSVGDAGDVGVEEAVQVAPYHPGDPLHRLKAQRMPLVPAESRTRGMTAAPVVPEVHGGLFEGPRHR